MGPGDDEGNDIARRKHVHPVASTAMILFW